MLYLVLSSSHYVHAFASHETLLCVLRTGMDPYEFA